MALPYVEAWNISKETPKEHAPINYDEGCYECRNHECWIKHAKLIECGGISNRGLHFRPIDELPKEERELFTYYTPILRCTGCGRMYFGNDTPTPQGEPVIRKTAEERITELEERIARLEEALASVINSKERTAIKAKAHEEHREQSPNQEEEYIILPSIMTV